MYVVAAVFTRDISLSDIWKNMRSFISQKEMRKNNPFGYVAVAMTVIVAFYAGPSGLSTCTTVYKTYLKDIAYNECARSGKGIAVVPEEEKDFLIAYIVLSVFIIMQALCPVLSILLCRNGGVLKRLMSTTVL